MFFAANQSILSIMIVIMIGYFLAYKKLLDEKAISLITTIVINISLPMMMLNTILSNFNHMHSASNTNSNGSIIRNHV